MSNVPVLTRVAVTAAMGFAHDVSLSSPSPVTRLSGKRTLRAETSPGRIARTVEPR
jgi:hypothetical protein